MRILFTADPEVPVPPVLYGGIERIVDGLIGELRARGHQVGLAAHPASAAAVDAFFPWPGASSDRPLDTLRNTLAVRRAVRAFRPDVVHSFSRVWHLIPVLRSRLPKVMSYQRFPHPRNVAVARRLGGRSVRFTGCSQFICDMGRRGGGGDWTAIHNFIELAKFTFVPRVADDAPLVFLSRLEWIKGTDLAIAAARRAGRRLVIAGNYTTGPAPDDHWRDHVQPHLGQDGIEYVGPVDDRQKDELLGRAAALIVPIRWDEPFGIVFAEALACGTPVISSPRGALPEIVRDGRDGFLCDSPDGLASAIARLASIDRRGCRQRADELFALPLAADRYERLYASMVAEAR